MNTLELRPNNSSQKSFYNKALVYIDYENDTPVYKLYSYNIYIATVKGSQLVDISQEWSYSATTLKHVKEFLYQFAGIEPTTKNKLNDYFSELGLLV